jgi:hypothetical protein
MQAQDASRSQPVLGIHEGKPTQNSRQADIEPTLRFTVYLGIHEGKPPQNSRQADIEPTLYGLQCTWVFMKGNQRKILVRQI